MKLRPTQLVCLALLLSTLSIADLPALAQADYRVQCSYLLVLSDYGNLTSTAKRQQPKANPATAPRNIRQVDLPSAARAVAQTVWTMRPPSAHYAALQSFTGFGRASA